MIRRVIFDFGKVLVHFEPADMVGQYISDPADAAITEEVLFDRLYWDKADAGTITDEELLEAVHGRLPARLWDTAAEIYRNWIYMLPEIDGMRALLEDLKAAHVPLALLSNISSYFADHSDEIPILSFFEHRVFSAVCGMTKPHRDIFEHICALCDCAPEDALFIDDSALNVDGAKQAGLQTYHFDGNADALRRFLTENGLLSA
ncbi:MAG: HAD family phosphatase [Clostridia bacterium]|nr:HAD family phosphatase [Clostridia bacterium]